MSASAASTAAAACRNPASCPLSEATSSRTGRSATPPIPSATSMQPLSSSSATCAAAATKAKSERRALTSRKPTPTRRCGQTGNLIALTHLPCPIAVTIGPTKKSPAGIAVEPFVVASKISASSVTATSGISADGIGMCDRAADGAAIARRGMTDPRQYQRQHRHRTLDDGIALGLRLARGCADHDRAGLLHECRQVREVAGYR